MKNLRLGKGDMGFSWTGCEVLDGFFSFRILGYGQVEYVDVFRYERGLVWVVGI